LVKHSQIHLGISMQQFNKTIPYYHYQRETSMTLKTIPHTQKYISLESLVQTFETKFIRLYERHKSKKIKLN